MDANRVSMTANNDSADYRLDAAGWLRNASVNRMVEQDLSRFSLGQANQVDVSGGALNLLEFGDALTGTAINTDRWRIAESAYTFVGHELRENGALQFGFPRGYWSQQQYTHAPFDNSAQWATPPSTLSIARN